MKNIICFCFIFFSSASLYSQTITIDTTGVYKINALYQTPPQFPRDINAWLAKSFNSKGTGQGEAFVSFVVETNGTISTVRKMGGGTIGGNAENAAVQIVEAMPKWKPARDASGKPVTANYQLGFVFGR